MANESSPSTAWPRIVGPRDLGVTEDLRAGILADV